MITDSQLDEMEARARSFRPLAENDALSLVTEVRRLRDRDEERRRKRGSYWTSPEGRAELRALFDDHDDGNAVRPLLDALVAAEAERDAAIRERDALIEAVRKEADYAALCAHEASTMAAEDAWADVSARLRAIAEKGGRS